jgi:small subunit ribosomal protein S21
MTGSWAVNVDFPSGPATYGTNTGFLGGAEPFGGTLRTQGTARHKSRSIAHGLTLLWRLRNNIGSISRDGGCVELAEVRIQDGESIENALRRFKRKVQQEDIIKEVKKHSFYLKPGEKKRIKQALARKRSRKKIRKVIPEE